MHTAYADFQTAVLALAPLGILDEELLTCLGQFYAARGLTRLTGTRGSMASGN